MSRDAFSFVMYIIHACARKWGRTPSEVYHALKRSGCLEGYLVRHYDALHTMSAGNVVLDVEEYLRSRKVTA